MKAEKQACPCGNETFTIMEKTRKNRPNSVWVAKCAKCRKTLDEFMTISQIAWNLVEMKG